jgi:hypothetical protein
MSNAEVGTFWKSDCQNWVVREVLAIRDGRVIHWNHALRSSADNSIEIFTDAHTQVANAQGDPLPEYHEATKHPVGLRPRVIADRARINEILQAMRRYSDASTPIPIAWIEELQDFAE